MILRPSKSLKAISLFVVLSLTNLYVFASPANTTSSGMLYGRLIMNGNTPVLVNGNISNSGTTIFSGSHLQTPDGVEASVQLGAVGRVDIAPNTELTLTFDKENVNVKVVRGNAFLSTTAGVKGSITTPDNKTTATGGEPGRAPAPALSNKEKAAIVIPIVIGVTVILVLVLNDDDSSPRRV